MDIDSEGGSNMKRKRKYPETIGKVPTDPEARIKFLLNKVNDFIEQDRPLSAQALLADIIIEFEDYVAGK